MNPSDILMGMALRAYAYEPCRICGKPGSPEQLRKDQLVFAGYAPDGLSRTAHRRCWQGMIAVARAFHEHYEYAVYEEHRENQGE